ncbi:MAG TPA: hypothetical protein VMU61_16050 [Candidatus Aquilonibacter sp.]|nr:hypothetical protein [Candidatus Aquilonibacter sp.]
MGLDAAVYKRLEELPFTKEDLRFVAVDPRTGQVDFEDAALFRAWSDKVKVVEKRIGNIALVSLLRAEMEKILGAQSSGTLLIRKVLYSGTHSGDIISKEDLSSLKHEIASVRKTTGQQLSPEVESFLADMEELIAASERHGNPIVFV